MRQLSVVVLNWNALQDTLACVRTVLAWKWLRVHLVIVDNASNSDEANQLVAGLPTATVISNLENRGFSGGCNTGIAHACAHDPMPVLLLNNDAVIEEQSVAVLMDALDRDSALGIVGPMIVAQHDASRIITSGGRSIARYQDTHMHDRPKTALRKCDFVSGAAALIRPEVFDRAGIFDEQFFFISEMADLSARARKAGLQTAVCAAAQARHNLARSSDSRGSLHPYYITRNRLLYLRKHGPRAALPVWAVLGLASAFKAAASGQRRMGCAIQLGVRDALSGRFGGQNERVLAHCA